MDEIDRTQKISEVYETAALRAHKAKRVTECSVHSMRIARYVSAWPCLDCGELIPEERCKANPEAERCVPCQTIFERGGSI